MSTDMRATWALRFFLWFVTVTFAFGATKIIDAIFKATLPGEPSDTVEEGVFVVLVATVIWRWLKERVWIGRQVP